MRVKKIKKKASAQAGNISFDMHTLGWEAFQNLCGHVAREILGQTVLVFSTTRDAGQDGAFQGVWRKAENEVYDGHFVLQCKFTARRDEHVRLADLSDELEKAKRLASRGFAKTYLLMTNAKLSGESDLEIRKAFLSIDGIDYFDAFGAEWLTQRILESKRLRAFVPRIYGLGDLSQILDERVYEQTNEILQTWRDNLAKFVPTEAHVKSVKAILDKGFVLLLGDPMAGKSTIAAALALAAADQWKSLPVFVTKPEDFRTHWNPNEPNQFFWVDDVFGQTQVDSTLVEGWSRIFPLLAAAVRGGAKILFTSRTYIYHAARREIKASAFPLILDSNVLIEVQNLTIQEKERILYNHLKLGQQTVGFRASVKPFLAAIASNPRFFPEIARRLGDPLFTKTIKFDEHCLKQFVEEPKEILCDIIKQLDRHSFAALALLFMRAGKSLIPLELEKSEVHAIEQLGASVADLREAMIALEGSLLNKAFETGEQLWRLRHPSIRDAMAAHVAGHPDLLDIYLAGVKPAELLNEVVCGDRRVEGAKVFIPISRFGAVASKLRGLDINDWHVRYKLLAFLDGRCVAGFQVVWFDICRNDFDELCGRLRAWGYRWFSLILSFHRSGVLPEEKRKWFVQEAIRRAVEGAEGKVICDEDLQSIFSADELKIAFDRVRKELPNNLASIVEDMATDYTDVDEEPSDYFQELRSGLITFGEYFEYAEELEMVKVFDHGFDLVHEAEERLDDWRQEVEEEAKKKKAEDAENRHDDGDDNNLDALIERYEQGGVAVRTSGPSSPTGYFKMDQPRSIFDDVDS